MKTETEKIAPELDKFLAGMLKSFEELFVKQKCQNDILTIINALENGLPILSLEPISSGSFSSIFLPFHINTILGNDDEKVGFKDLVKAKNFYPDFISFCELAAEIEGMTDILHLESHEPDTDYRKLLDSKLKIFLQAIPDLLTFKKWISPSF